MIKDECFLCEEPIFSRELCKKHYAVAYRLSKKPPIDLAVDLLIYREALNRRTGKECDFDEETNL